MNDCVSLVSVIAYLLSVECAGVLQRLLSCANFPEGGLNGGRGGESCVEGEVF